MCLAIPGRIVRVTEGTDGTRTAEVEYPGSLRSVSLLYLPDARVGDHILVQAGFGIRLLTAAQAAEVHAAMTRAAELTARMPSVVAPGPSSGSGAARREPA